MVVFDPMFTRPQQELRYVSGINSKQNKSWQVIKKEVLAIVNGACMGIENKNYLDLDEKTREATKNIYEWLEAYFDDGLIVR